MLPYLRSLVATIFLAAILAQAGCETTWFGRRENVIDLRVARSHIRDVVREAARHADGEPIFEKLDTNYAFEDDRFHIEGEYRAADGSLRRGYLELAFSVEGGEPRVTIVEHDIPGIEGDIERINAALTTALEEMVADSLSQNIVSYRHIEPLAYNILEISLTAELDPDSMIVPLPQE